MEVILWWRQPLKKGILKITIPEAEEAGKKEIEIKVK